MTNIEKKKKRKAQLEELMKQNRRSGKYKKLNLITGVLLGMFLTICGYLIYNLYKLTGIENTIRYIVIILLGFLGLYLIIKYLKMIKKPLLRKYIIFILTILALGVGEYFIAYTINKGLNVVENISAKKYKTYSTSLVALKDGKLKSKTDVTAESKIGRVNNKSDIEGYKLTKYLMKKDNITDKNIQDYDDPITMLYDLYEGTIDGVFISSSYVNVYGKIEKFENIGEETTILDTYKKKMKVQNSKENYASTKSVTEPFTMLLMGVDSDEEDLSKTSGLGDSLMVITFNPKTLNATIFSIPRDTFVPITCYRNAKSKITHAASGGDKCMINTIQNFLDVDIDYYAKINFRGLIKLVDALGGIDVEVPYSFCETTMWRSQEYMVYVEEGMQHLNGEQALGLSRNRKTYPSCGAKYNKGTRNDFVRGQNQQLVISAIMNKAKELNNISQFYGILDALGSSMQTNMDRKQILSFYNVFKNILLNSKDLTDENDIINMQKLYLNGTGGLYQDGIMNMELYEYIPSTQSLNAIKKAMKVNLELEEEEPATEFSFSADEDYEQKIIGKDLSGGVDTPAKSTTTTTKTTTSCGNNEELGADGVTCLCKSGYARKNGECVKKTEETTTTETKTEESSITCKNGTVSGNSCTCWAGYEDSDGDGVCTEKEEEPEISCTNGTVVAGSCECWDGYDGPDSSGYCTQQSTDPEGNNTP